jgi:UDP-N-acetylglucosamine 4,6-dehydratase/5-epimerase
MRILDVAAALAPDAERVITGIRPGEKLHEVLLTEDESRHSYDIGDRYVILPARVEPTEPIGDVLADGFRYTSDSNDRWLTADELRAIAQRLGPTRRQIDRVGGSG